LSHYDYVVRIKPHGRTIRVRADQSVLDAALSAGLNLPHSCKSGHCSSCRARLRVGRIYYPNGRPVGLTATEEQEGHVLLCQARPLDDLELEARLIAAVDAVEIKTLPCRIERLQLLGSDVVQVWLRLPAVETLRFQPGQYLDVLLDGGRRRSFSIASPPHDSELIELHVRRVPEGGFTERLFRGVGTTASTGDALRVGSLLRVEGPVGQFTYHGGSNPILMVAGGTGFAPLKSMLRHILENGNAADRSIHLYWGTREVSDIYEEALILHWTRIHPNLRFTAVLSESPDTEGQPHRRFGWVHEAVLADIADLSTFDVYAAGPPAMIQAIRASFPRSGLMTDRLYFDSFDYAPDAIHVPTPG
jgi:CDP-4-dehydro-6-deoxyglucose reductase, E3